MINSKQIVLDIDKGVELSQSYLNNFPDFPLQSQGYKQGHQFLLKTVKFITQLIEKWINYACYSQIISSNSKLQLLVIF